MGTSVILTVCTTWLLFKAISVGSSQILMGEVSRKTIADNTGNGHIAPRVRRDSTVRQALAAQQLTSCTKLINTIYKSLKNNVAQEVAVLTSCDGDGTHYDKSAVTQYICSKYVLEHNHLFMPLIEQNVDAASICQQLGDDEDDDEYGN